MTTYYVIYEDGSLGRIDTDGEGQPPLAKPGRFVDAATYGARSEELAAQHAQHVADLQAADEARTKADYDALIEAGIPEATARRLSGYQGE
ncbi:hypothetical protein PV518_48070 [Streptomyces sp. ND04-05B]|uniref:hypothetical protein n=1 Tax=Streptomyces sp. ND04-05B TaxID=3028693 RepID=UPI0029A27867|nr:hypothetical protein [Streptomyces sp. ND04-05B]MDX3069794.1 hypothetical protein [Streptomyces sp. ND04-05B]